MDFLSLAKQRCSVRSYKNTPIDDEKVAKILEAARVAPTAANMQPQKILVIKSREGLSKLTNGVNAHEAPLVFIVCADKKTAWVRPFDKKSMVDVDATIVSDHMVMEAEDLGLGSCWLTYFKPDVIKKSFNIPNDYEPVAILAMGYPNELKSPETRHSSTRHSLDKIVSYENF